MTITISIKATGATAAEQRRRVHLAPKGADHAAEIDEADGGRDEHAEAR